MPSHIPHDFPFDPTYGHTLQDLLTIPGPADVPSDYHAFWREAYARALATPPNVSRREDSRSTDELLVEEIEFDSLDGFRVGGWLTTPRCVEAPRTQVVGHGYGGREAPDLVPAHPPAVRLFPCARGFHRSAQEGYPNTGHTHVLHGIDDRYEYSHLGSTADVVWCAANALAEVAGTHRPMDFYGGSFSGGLGAFGLGVETRFRRAALQVPSFGNHPLRLTLEMVGSGQAVRELHKTRPEIMETLRYFDAATSATFITTPTLFLCAAFDPAVPPPGQFAVYNAATCEKQLLVSQAGHFQLPGITDVDDWNQKPAMSLWYAMK